MEFSGCNFDFSQGGGFTIVAPVPPPTNLRYLWNWGRNSFGQLGDNTLIHRSSPVQTIAGGINWSSISSGSQHTLAIKTDGTLWGWGGNNRDGALGDGTIIHRSSPVQTAAGGTNWRQVSLGDYSSSAAIKTDGTLWTWGKNAYGELGDNTTIHRSQPVQTVSGGTNWSTLSSGHTSVYSIKTDGTLWSWGYNSYGKLGTNDRTHRSSPVQTIAGGSNWSQVSGGYGALAIKTDGTLWSWGRNLWGTVGDNTTTPRSSPVQTISGGTNWANVSSNEQYCIATKTDGTLWIWGRNNYGQLGDNQNIIDRRSSPVQTIAGGTDWKQISAGYFQAVAIKGS